MILILEAIPYIALFAVGTIIGSFLNVVIYRVPNDKSILFPPSACPNCGRGIKPYENIPIFSYLFLRGKCAGCHSPISIQYPVVEGLAGLILVGLLYRFGWDLDRLIYAPLLLILLALSVIDLQVYRLPNPIVLAGAILGLALLLLVRDRSLVMIGGGALLGGGLLWFNWLVGRVLFKRDGVGMGDIKLATMLGMWMGPGYILQTFFWAVVSAAFIGIGMIVVKRTGMSQKIPFGPFLALGTVVTIFWGEQIWLWYQGFSGLMRP